MSLVNIAVSIAVVVAILLVYKYGFNPQVVVTPTRANMSQCPDNWNFSDGLCRPSYKTTCAPFDPTKVTSAPQGCNIARTCGTNWSGMCA